MAGVMFEAGGLPLGIVTAGTHVLEHQPMSIRTRAALRGLGLDIPPHRSHQLVEADIDAADLVIAMAGEHVRYVRRRHPAGADRTATLPWLCRHLPDGPGSLEARVAALDLAVLDPDDQGDVEDPAGGDEAVYHACAAELALLVAELAPRLA